MKWNSYENNGYDPFKYREGREAIRKAQQAKLNQRFMVRPHQNKERTYVQALRAFGWRAEVGKRFDVRFALFDQDVASLRPRLDACHKLGIPVMMYPHSARPMVQWDIFPPWPHTRVAFVIGPGHAEVMRRYGYPFPTEVTGWALCKQVPFRPTPGPSLKGGEPFNVLYGPIHPFANGYCPPVEENINREAFNRILAWCRESGAHLTVRHIGDLSQNGIPHVHGVKYVLGKKDSSTTMIDEADLVIGHQTFAYMAVARGKPVMMMGEEFPPWSGNSDNTLAVVKQWEKYADYLMFPLDILRGPGNVADTDALIRKACEGTPEVDEWKAKFIGEPLWPEEFVQAVERWL